MLIIYLAIILVVLGFIFVITSVEIRKEKVIVNNNKKPVAGNSNFEPISSQINDDIFIQIPDQQAESKVESSQENNEPSAIIGQSNNIYDVALYIDGRGFSEDIINSDPSALKNVTREGSGTAEITPDAITIRIEKKLYRFDYYRLDKVGGSGNCAVLSLQGNKGAFFAVADKTTFYGQINEEYTQFKNR